MHTRILYICAVYVYSYIVKAREVQRGRTARVGGDLEDAGELDDRAELDDDALGLAGGSRARLLGARAAAGGRARWPVRARQDDHGQRAQVQSGQAARARVAVALGGEQRGAGARAGALLEEHEVALEHEQQVVRAVLALALALRVLLLVLVAPHAAPVDVLVAQQLQLREVQAAIALRQRLGLERAVAALEPAICAE